MVRKGKEAAPSDVAPTEDGGHITITAQQSRYAMDAIDAPASKEVLIKDLSISVADRELLSHVQLHLVEGRHYVLVGRNGTGKSTLLKAMADGLIPGIPWSTKILLLGQTAESLEDDLGALKLESETVLQHVLGSDKVRERYLKEAKALSAAIDHPSDSVAPVRALRQITHERLSLQLKESHRIAERRSGARGKQARKELIKLEEKFVESESQLKTLDGAIDPTRLSEETRAAAELLSNVQGILESMNASEAETKARTILWGLGFKDEKIDRPMSELSGGWKTRCDLACALVQYADVLLLDEPTNFLDLPSIIWLQEYICNLKSSTVLITTHDRAFGDAIAEELLVLRNQSLESFRGNLSLYERERHKKAKWMTAMKEAQEKQKKHMEKSIQGNIKAAREKGDDKKLKQAASRKKKLEDRTGLEVGLRGGRFKLSRDRVGYGLTRRAEIEIPDFDPPVRISIPSHPPDLRFPGALVSLENVSFSYPAPHSTPILKDINLSIHPGERVGLAGLNGSGKTTLVSLIMDSNQEKAGRLIPLKGTITYHARARFDLFSQQSVEEITEIAQKTPTLTALSYLVEIAAGTLTEKEARLILAALGLQGQTVSDVPLGLLSGGQKVRIALARVLWQPPQLLVLDEVTTHLDSDTILGLVLALREYEGALLVVTHDRFFMRTVVEGESPYKFRSGAGAEEESDEDDSEGEEAGLGRKRTVYRLFRGQLKKLEGGMEQYEEIAARAAARLVKTQAR